MRINRGVLAAVWMTAFVFADVSITAQDVAVDNDVDLENPVRKLQDAPQDLVNATGYVITFVGDESKPVVADGSETAVKDESEPAVKGVASVVDGESAHSKAQREGELAVEDAWDSASNIRFRSYKVNDSIGDLLQAYATDKSVPAIDVAEFFTDVEFPEETSARYLPEFRSLFVNQTLPNLLAIEEVLAGYQDAQKNLLGHQIEIEAKFIEVSQSTLDELGFAWTFSGKDGGDLQLFDDFSLPSGTEILSSGLRGATTALPGSSAAGTLGISGVSRSLKWDLVISALEQANDSDVLSAPRVVTHSGQEATIAVGEDHMIPKSFEIENQETSPYVQYASWELELMGVHMTVTPQIRMDGLIDLNIHSRILDIIGYDSYQITPELTSGPGGSVPFGGNPSAEASLPFFRIRKLDTRATVADGSTIGMGGLIYDKRETFRDKVPVLGSIPLVGRLFSSNGKRSVKRNLMIFVTATQVDVDGRRQTDLVLKK